MVGHGRSSLQGALHTIVWYPSPMAENVKRVNVTLPIEQVDRIKRIVAERPSDYPSVAAFVGEATARMLHDEEAHDMLLSVLGDLGGEPTEADRRWAAEAMRLADHVAREGASDTKGVA